MRFLNVFLVLSCFCCKAQDNPIHTSKVLGINFNISKNTRVQTLNSGMGETYLVYSDGKEFEYTLTINKYPSSNLTFENFKGNEFKNSYLSTCSCIIESDQIQNYKHFKTYQYTTITESEGQKLYGLIDYLGRNGDVYSLVYLTTFVNYEKFKSSYRKVLESINFQE